ncbi:hypothetical protein [Prescottella equi]|uniref:hypothetical protein n=1 Tax=Rhodococcus hoagii TaxID=43767 RepID=UPI0007CD4F8B|nr:hypothetical protein [Prescottella equi]
MTTPAPQNTGAPSETSIPEATFSIGASGSVTGSAVDAFEVDLSDMLDGPGSTEVSMQSFDGGIAAGGGISVGSGVEVSIGAPGGLPEVSIDAGGQFAVDGQYGAYGSYDDVDLSVDAQTGTSEVSIDSAEAGVSGYGGADGGAEFGVDLSVNPLDGVPEIGVDTGFEFDADNGFDVGGGCDHVEIIQDDSGSVM